MFLKVPLSALLLCIICDFNAAKVVRPIWQANLYQDFFKLDSYLREELPNNFDANANIDKARAGGLILRNLRSTKILLSFNAATECTDKLLDKIDVAAKGTALYKADMNSKGNLALNGNTQALRLVNVIGQLFTPSFSSKCIKKFTDEFNDLTLKQLDKSLVANFQEDCQKNIQDKNNVISASNSLVRELIHGISSNEYTFEDQLANLAKNDPRFTYKSIESIRRITDNAERKQQLKNYVQLVSEYLAYPCDHLMSIYEPLFKRLSNFLEAAKHFSPSMRITDIPNEMVATIRNYLQCPIVMKYMKEQSWSTLMF